MKTDSEVHLMLRERKNGKTLEQAAARAGMSVPTARKYLRAAKLPSALKSPRTYLTHPNPFAADWPWVEAQLQRDPALQAKTLFTVLCEEHPDRYSTGQLRTFQRHVAKWRALHGPERDVIFEQVHLPGRLAHSKGIPSSRPVGALKRGDSGGDQCRCHDDSLAFAADILRTTLTIPHQTQGALMLFYSLLAASRERTTPARAPSWWSGGGSHRSAPGYAREHSHYPALGSSHAIA
jgi:hypothetical protein